MMGLDREQLDLIDRATAMADVSSPAVAAMLRELIEALEDAANVAWEMALGDDL